MKKLDALGKILLVAVMVNVTLCLESVLVTLAGSLMPVMYRNVLENLNVEVLIVVSAKVVVLVCVTMTGSVNTVRSHVTMVPTVEMVNVSVTKNVSPVFHVTMSVLVMELAMLRANVNVTSTRVSRASFVMSPVALVGQKTVWVEVHVTRQQENATVYLVGWDLDVKYLIAQELQIVMVLMLHVE